MYIYNDSLKLTNFIANIYIFIDVLCYKIIIGPLSSGIICWGIWLSARLEKRTDQGSVGESRSVFDSHLSQGGMPEFGWRDETQNFVAKSTSSVRIRFPPRDVGRAVEGARLKILSRKVHHVFESHTSHIKNNYYNSYF